MKTLVLSLAENFFSYSLVLKYIYLIEIHPFASQGESLLEYSDPIKLFLVS